MSQRDQKEINRYTVNYILGGMTLGTGAVSSYGYFIHSPMKDKNFDSIKLMKRRSVLAGVTGLVTLGYATIIFNNPPRKLAGLY